MSSDVALRVEGLSKRYTIRHKDHDHVTLAQSALHRLRHPRGALGREEFSALREVSFEVSRGEVLGVIGHNGAGKSTLLKVLSRITPPTAGRVEVFGRIGSLLEVGTGFHPELTGRENIYLNGSILGMRKREIDRQFDAIVDFSGVKQFLDTPVKRYSSGMYVRLAFAVAAHLDTEILLLDEVLAVGDADFQKKCLRKMGEVAHDGRTVLLVSHNMLSVRDLARQALLFERGVLLHSGTATDVIERYRARTSALNSCETDLRDKPRPHRSLPLEVSLTHVRLETDDGVPAIRWGSAPRLIVRLSGRSLAMPLSFSVTVRNSDGQGVGVCAGQPLRPPPPGEECDIELTLPPLRLRPGSYALDIAISNGSVLTGRTGVDVDKVEEALRFEVSPPNDAEQVVGRWWSGFGAVNLGNLVSQRLSLDLEPAPDEAVRRSLNTPSLNVQSLHP